MQVSMGENPYKIYIHSYTQILKQSRIVATAENGEGFSHSVCQGRVHSKEHNGFLFLEGQI